MHSDTLRGYEQLIPVMEDDPKDRHVLAAAVRAGARLIVTWNVRDFLARAGAPYDIEVRHADAFLLDLLDTAPEAMARVICERAADLLRPPQSSAQVLARLARTALAFAREMYRRLAAPDPAP